MARDHILHHITMTLYRELGRYPSQIEIRERIRKGVASWELNTFQCMDETRNG